MTPLRNRWRSGVSSLEFALIMPILLAMLVGLTEWGLAIDSRIQLQTAVRAGAQYALRMPTDTAGIASAVRAAVPERTDLSVPAPTMSCECAGAAAECSGACAGGMERFLTVSASHSYTPLTPVGPTLIAADVTLRIQ